MIAFLLFGYLLGSVPFGLVLTRLAGYGDIRNIGSGNIGATNVLRTGNKPLAAATLVLDSGKGAIAALLALWIAGQDAALLAGLGAVCGHLFPVWLKFRGGKGVATTLGTLLAVAPMTGILACGIWLAMAAAFRISSLAALVAVGLSPLLSHFLYGNPNLSALCAVLAALVWIKHRSNIKRLFAGEEPKIGKKDKNKEPQLNTDEHR